MTGASLHVCPVSGDALISRSETRHWVCCLDSSTALCGVECDPEDDGDEADPNCVVCAELFEDAPEFCPCRPFCPEFVVPV